MSIPFNCSDTALGVTEAMIGLKVKIFVFHHMFVLFFEFGARTRPQDLWPFLKVVTRMDTPKSGIRSETGTE